MTREEKTMMVQLPNDRVAVVVLPFAAKPKRTNVPKPQHVREKVAYHDYPFKPLLCFFFSCICGLKKVYFVWLNFTASQTDELFVGTVTNFQI
jgi:hypothetical protein